MLNAICDVFFRQKKSRFRISGTSFPGSKVCNLNLVPKTSPQVKIQGRGPGNQAVVTFRCVWLNNSEFCDFFSGKGKGFTDDAIAGLSSSEDLAAASTALRKTNKDSSGVSKEIKEFGGFLPVMLLQIKGLSTLQLLQPLALLGRGGSIVQPWGTHLAYSMSALLLTPHCSEASSASFLGVPL